MTTKNIYSPPKKSYSNQDQYATIAANPPVSLGEETIPTPIMLHITRTMTDHIPLSIGSGPAMTIGQMIDAHLVSIAAENQTVAHLELEIPPDQWNAFAATIGRNK